MWLAPHQVDAQLRGTLNAMGAVIDPGAGCVDQAPTSGLPLFPRLVAQFHLVAVVKAFCRD